MESTNRERSHVARALSAVDAIDIVYFSFYVAIFFFLASQHALFRDEGQPWLRAVRTTSIAEFFDSIRYTRYPPLHFIFMRAAYACWSLFSGAQWYRISSFVSWSFHLGFVAFLVFGFRAPRWLRYSVPFGIVFLFDHGIVTHTYHLGNFFMILAAWFKTRGKARGSWISLTLAANVHLIYTLLAGGFFAWDLWESRKRLRGLDWSYAFFCSLGFLFALLFVVIKPSDAIFDGEQQYAMFTLRRSLNFFDMGMTGFQRFFSWTSFSFITWILAFVPVTIFLAMSLQGFPLGPYLVTTLPLFLFFQFWFEPGRRHAVMFFLAALLWNLIHASDFKVGKRVPTLFAFFCVSMMMCTASWLIAWNPFQKVPSFDYSGSKELVEKIGPMLKSKDAVLVADPALRYMSVSAILDIVLFDPRGDRFYPYPFFKQSDYKMTFDQWCGFYGGKLSSKFPGKKVFFGLKKGFDPPAACGPWRLVFQSTRTNPKYSPGGEDFVVYQALQ
jgi:hypothetical protein